MSEIKSTLDLVMQKTKHLTLSDDEKADQQHKEIEQKIKGLITKFQDGALKMEQLEREFKTLRNVSEVTLRKRIAQEVLNRLDIQNDNDRLIRLLIDFCGMDIDPIVSLLNEAKQEMQKAKTAIGKKILSELKNEQAISGLAVGPNIEADAEYNSEMEKNMLRFRKALDQGSLI